MTDVFSSRAIKERRQKEPHWIPVMDDEESRRSVERKDRGGVGSRRTTGNKKTVRMLTATARWSNHADLLIRNERKPCI